MSASEDRRRHGTRSGLPMSELIYTVHPAIKGSPAAIRIERAREAGNEHDADEAAPARGDGDRK